MCGAAVLLRRISLCPDVRVSELMDLKTGE